MKVIFREKRGEKKSLKIPQVLEGFFCNSFVAVPWHRKTNREPNFSRWLAECTEHHQQAELSSLVSCIGQEKVTGMAMLGDISTTPVAAGHPLLWRSSLAASPCQGGCGWRTQPCWGQTTHSPARLPFLQPFLLVFPIQEGVSHVYYLFQLFLPYKSNKKGWQFYFTLFASLMLK